MYVLLILSFNGECVIRRVEKYDETVYQACLWSILHLK